VDDQPRPWRGGPALAIAATALALSTVATVAIALGAFDQTILGLEPVTWIVAAGIAAGAGYMVIPAAMPGLQTRPGALYWVLGIGLAWRLIMMVPDPILEIDYSRYLWDGAVINAGFSPYEWSPGEVLSGAAPEEVTRLARDAPAIAGAINYPHLTTIYPPAAEFVFALANRIAPWDVTVWRLVVLAFEIATVALLYRVLVALRRPPLWIVIYWWNPIVIFEFSNAGHMDAMLLPFLVAALLFAVKPRAHLATAVCLAVATAIKLWPVLLLPIFLRRLAWPRPALTAGAVFVVVTAALLWPFITQAFHDDAGLRAYGVSWERNASLFHVLLGGLRAALDGFGWFDLDAGRILRTAVGAVVILVALAINWRAAADPHVMVRRMIIVMATLLLLGPTLYPWYYTWMVPFLAIAPSPALLALTVLLPLYRLQFHPWFLENSGVFTDWVVWAEQGPVFVLLFMAWRGSNKDYAP
jgi:hypothetical protein